MQKAECGIESSTDAKRSPFDKLRVNGSGIETVEDLPFVLSPLRLRSGQASTSSGRALSKHEHGLFGSLPVLSPLEADEHVILSRSTAEAKNLSASRQQRDSSSLRSSE